MARRLFFVPPVHSGHTELRGDDARHLTKVLRVEPGHVYEISDQDQLYLAKVTAAHKELVRFEVLEKLEIPPEPCHLVLVPALVKFDKLEWILEKATELGVGEIRPFWSARTEKGLEQAAAKRIDRWRKILLESAQQCRRARLPEIAEPAAFATVLATGAAERYLLDESRTGEFFRPGPCASAALLVGPEGGFTEAERQLAIQAGWRPVSLGPRILRAETAALAALSILGNAQYTS